MYDISYVAQRLLQPSQGDNTQSGDSQGLALYKDAPFIILFGINLIIITCCGLSTGISAVKAIDYYSYTSISTSGSSKSSHESSQDFIGGVFLCLFVGLFLSIALVISLAKLSHHIINATIVVTSFISLLCGIILFTVGYLVAGLLLLLLTVFCVVFYLYMRPYIQFASVILKIACQAIQQLPSLFLTTTAVLSFQAVFSLLWILAVIGTATNESNTKINYGNTSYSLDQCTSYSYYSSFTVDDITISCTSSSKCHACICDNGVVVSSTKSCTKEKLYGVSYFFLLLSLFWTYGVCANVVHCTVAASVNKWWANPNPPSYQIVWDSFRRSITYSFGSICLGSLFVAIIKTIRNTLNFVRYQLKNAQFSSSMLKTVASILLSMIDYLLRVVESITEYFNSYAYCFVAIYGYSFLESSRAAVGLFRDRGWNAVINDDIIDYVLSLSHILIGILSSLLIFGYCHGQGISSVNTTLLLVMAYNCGHFMSTVTTNIISSAVATIFVCFAEKTELFQVCHPVYYQELMEAWSKFYPDDTPVAEKGYEAKGTYLPPHLAENPRKGGYNPVFSFDIENSDDHSVGSAPRSQSNQAARFVISGRYIGSESEVNPQTTSNDQNADNGITKKIYEGVVDQTSKVIGHTTKVIDHIATFLRPSDVQTIYLSQEGPETNNISNNWNRPSEQTTTIRVNDVEESISF